MARASLLSPRSWQPNAQQRQLLKAVIYADRSAWQDWAQRIDLDTLDEGSYHLLPRLYRQLQQLDWQPLAVTDDMMRRLKGVYRHVWSRNQVNLHHLSTAIAALADQDISTCLLWGAATVSRPGADLGICRTDDGSLLVRGDDLLGALATLQRLGWVPTQKKSAAVLRSQQHAVGLQHPNQAPLTLHWHPLPAYRLAEDTLWQRSQTVTVGQAKTQVPDPTDQFLLSCVRATRWGTIPAFPWLADAAALINTLDVPYLLAQAQTGQLTYALTQALGVLATLEPNLSPVLSHILEQLRQQSASRPTRYFERAEFRAYASRSIYGSLPTLWFQWARLRPDHSAPGFLAFLQQRWGLQQPWQVPLHLMRQSGRKIYRFGGN